MMHLVVEMEKLATGNAEVFFSDCSVLAPLAV